MPQFFQLTRPVLRAAAGFHANQTRFTITEVFQSRVALNLLVDNFTSMLINEMKLHQIFCDIDANRGQLSGLPNQAL
ncbi:hypothetical protein CISECK367B_14665 [Citrobacter sedlakii]